MDVKLCPCRLRGAVTPPPCKSLAHRVILAELLSGRKTFSVSPDLSEDVRASLSCAETLRREGIPVLDRRASSPASRPEILRQEGVPVLDCGESGPASHPEILRQNGIPVLDCGESGSTLRFLLPLSLVLRGGGVFTGQGRLMDRPLSPYRALFAERGIAWERGEHSLTVRGRLTPGEYRLPGGISSQFVTGLLFALPLLDGSSVLRLTSPLESRPYVEMTLDVLRRSGVTVRRPDAQTFRIPGGQRYHSPEMPVEADWSQAAFWYAANFLGGGVELRGLHPSSVQGDREIAELVRGLGNPEPVPVEIDLSGIPDLLPPLAVMAAWRRGRTRFIRAGRLRAKESDRLESTAALLRAFGVPVETGPDWMQVHGGISASPASLSVDGENSVSPAPVLEDGEIPAFPAPVSADGEIPASLRPVTVDGAGDHRIVMAAAVLASVWDGPVVIRGAEAVRKSYPEFFTHYRQLGGEVHVL